MSAASVHKKWRPLKVGKTTSITRGLSRKSFALDTSDITEAGQSSPTTFVRIGKSLDWLLKTTLGNTPGRVGLCHSPGMLSKQAQPPGMSAFHPPRFQAPRRASFAAVAEVLRLDDATAREPEGQVLQRSPSVTSITSAETHQSGDSDLGTMEDFTTRSCGADGMPLPAVAATRIPRDTAPLQDARGETPRRSDVLNDRSDVGNLGFLFGNWGLRAADKAVQRNIDIQLKHGPAQILVLAECEAATQDILRAPAVAADPNADEGFLLQRPGYQYWAARGQEDASVCVAARRSVAEHLEVLYWNRHDDHQYSDHGRVRMAQSRTLIAKVHLSKPLGFVGSELVVCGVHLHRMTRPEEVGAGLQQVLGPISE